MHRLALVAVSCLALVACATTSASSVTLDVKKGLTAASALYVSVCGGVKAAHDAGALRGQAFNDAKKTCLQADALLDAADLALAIGKGEDAAADVQAAFLLLERVGALKES